MKRKRLPGQIRAQGEWLEKANLAKYGKDVPAIARQIECYQNLAARLAKKETLDDRRWMDIEERSMVRQFIRGIQCRDAQFFRNIADTFDGKFKVPSPVDKLRYDVIFLGTVFNKKDQPFEKGGLLTLKQVAKLTSFEGELNQLRRIARDCNCHLAPEPKGRPRKTRTNKARKNR